MKLRHPVLVLLTTLSVAAAAQAPAGLLPATFAQMDAAAARFKGMTADVKKVSHVNVYPDDDVATGTIAVKRSKPTDLRMRVDLAVFNKEPDLRIACFADHTGEIYNPKINTVQIYDVTRVGSAMVDQLFLLGFGSSASDIQSAYTVKLGGEESINGQKTVRLELTPKSPNKLGDISKVELWISQAPDTSGLAVQQKFYEGKGYKDYNLATYTNMKLNRNLPDSAVKCDLPKNVHKEYPRGR
jgi:outer membrane lipoprotein-sorting protein